MRRLESAIFDNPDLRISEVDHVIRWHDKNSRRFEVRVVLGVLEEEQSGHIVRFHCHVGHQLSERALLHAQGDTLEAALWTALRVLEERIHLAERVEKRAIANGNELLARRFHDQNADALQKAKIIRRVLLGGDGHQPVTKLQDEVVYDDDAMPEPEKKIP